MEKNWSYDWSLLSCKTTLELSNTSRIIALIKWHIILTDWIRQGCSSFVPNILRLPSLLLLQTTCAIRVLSIHPFNFPAWLLLHIFTLPVFSISFHSSKPHKLKGFASLCIIPPGDLCPMTNPSFSSIFLSAAYKLRRLSETRVAFNYGPFEGQLSRSNSYGDKNKNRHISLYILNGFALH